MTPTQEQVVQWARDAMEPDGCDPLSPGRTHIAFTLDEAATAYRLAHEAGRKAGLEEAAKLCAHLADTVREQSTIASAYIDALGQAEKVIRARSK